MGSQSQDQEEYHDIVIVGAGICGLATALALHRKGIKSLVLEKHCELRDTGAAISIYLNGWRALDQLGIGVELRMKSIPITELHDVWISKDGMQITPIGKEGLQCVKRRDLVETLAESLPSKSIRFGCRIVALETDPESSFPVIRIEDGSILKTKVVIGCDGANSVVAKSLGLKETKLSSMRVAQGYTNYPNGHGFGSHFLRLWSEKIFLGRIPVDEKLVFWFTNQKFHLKDLEIRNYPKLIRDDAKDSLSNCSKELIEMAKHTDLSSLSLVRVRYRAPWHLAFCNFSKGTITVAGDAMHQMGPELAQGGCAALEDAVVLARCLSEKMCIYAHNGEVSDKEVYKRVRMALSRYERERRLRVLLLSTKAYLLGSLSGASWIKKIVCLVLLRILGGSSSHTQFDCGRL